MSASINGSVTSAFVILGASLALVSVAGAGSGERLPAKAPVVLGKKHLLPYGIGWGTAHPRLIFNGGDPGGAARHIVWRDWGAASARGRGLAAIPRPDGNYYAKPGVIELRAFRIGRCTRRGHRAYTRLQAREPKRPGGPLGRWFVWGGWKSICRAP